MGELIMNFTPNELQNIVFKKSLLGFHQNQVYDVVQRVVEDYSGYIHDNAKMKEKIEDMSGKIQYYRSIEISLQNSMIVAQQSSEEIVTNAKKQAENIVMEARVQALEIIDKANKQILTAIYEKERLHSELEAFRIRAESLLQAQIGLLKGLNNDEPVREPLKDMVRPILQNAAKTIAEDAKRDNIRSVSDETRNERMKLA